MDITVQELKQKMDNKESFVLIDVREPWENEEFNIGGQLIPLGDLMSKIPELESHKEEEVILYCRSGNRSGTAEQLLTSMGFKNARNMIGGVLQWQDVHGK